MSERRKICLCKRKHDGEKKSIAQSSFSLFVLTRVYNVLSVKNEMNEQGGKKGACCSKSLFDLFTQNKK